MIASRDRQAVQKVSLQLRRAIRQQTHLHVVRRLQLIPHFDELLLSEQSVCLFHADCLAVSGND